MTSLCFAHKGCLIMSHMSAPHIQSPLSVWVPYCQPCSPWGHKSQRSRLLESWFCSWFSFLVLDIQTNSHYILAVKLGNEEKQSLLKWIPACFIFFQSCGTITLVFQIKGGISFSNGELKRPKLYLSMGRPYIQFFSSACIKTGTN